MTADGKLAIGIDIDGTLSAYHVFFTELAETFRARGHRIYIITGLGTPDAEARLQKYWIPNDGLYHSGHYNDFERSMIAHLNHGQQASNECVLGAFKQRICRELGIDIMFDDQADIHQSFGQTPVFKCPQRKTT